MFKGFSSLFEKKRDDQYEGETTIQEGTGITLVCTALFLWVLSLYCLETRRGENGVQQWGHLWRTVGKWSALRIRHLVLPHRREVSRYFPLLGSSADVLGEWENDVQHGQGIASWMGYHLGSLGDQYDGKWERGLRVEVIRLTIGLTDCSRN